MSTKSVTLSSDDNPLSRSLLVETPQKTVDITKTRQLGSTVLDRAEQIYIQTKAVRNLAANAVQNPARFGCSILTLITGLGQLYHGDVFTGGAVTLLGAKEIYNQSCHGNTSSLEKMLNAINADVDMIKTLEEGQRQSYAVVEQNLGLLRQDVTGLYNKLDEIKALNTQGLKEIETGKSNAHSKALEAKEAYRTALGLFKESMDSFSLSKGTYAKCADYFTRIQDLAKDETTDVPLTEKVEKLVRTAKQASVDCAAGMNQLDGAEAKFLEAMQAYKDASALKDEAFEMISKVVQGAEDTLVSGKEKAAYEKTCTQRIAATEKELADIKERSDDIMKLLNEMSRDIKKAKDEAARKFDLSDMAVGIGAGVLLSSVGTVSAVAAGVTAAYSWHNGTTIAATTKKVYGYFFGEPEAPKQPMRLDELTRIKFDERSSGYFGAWVKGRASNTLGTLDVNLGTEIVPLRFNLNDAEYPISKEDLFGLYTNMHRQLGAKTLSPERCKDILQNLQTIRFDRGGALSAVTGAIKPEQAANGLVRALRKYVDKLQAAAKLERGSKSTAL